MTTELRHTLLGLVEVGAIKFGAFRLKLHDSHPEAPLSPIYIDLRITRSFPWLLRNLAGILGTKIMQLSPDNIADVPTAATPLVSLIAAWLQIPMLTPRLDSKTHGSGAQIDGVPSPGARVVLVDDLITTAESKLAAVELLRSAQLLVPDVVVFLDREQGGKEQLAAAGCTLHATLTISQMLDFFVAEQKIEPHRRTAIDQYFATMRRYRRTQ